MISILLDHFYKIDSLQAEGNSINASVTFDIDHPIFRGHFPDMPIVPGVCQTQMLSEVISQALGSDLHLRSAASIKFLSIVDPTQNLSLDMTITSVKNEDGSYNVSAQYKSRETIFFKFKGVFAA
jgi:3-hydroxyacyl-[acyl-carrier-protein] dehydratase